MMLPKEISQAISKWYGKPGFHTTKSKKSTGIVLLGSSIEQVLMAASFVAEGKSVTLITVPQIVHKIIPHPANKSIDNTEFFRRLPQVAHIQPETNVYEESVLWNDRGYLLYEMGWKVESLECFLRAVGIDRNLPPVWTNLGRYFMDPEVRDFALASQCLDKALDIDPNDGMALANRGAIAVEQHQFEIAIDFCNKAIKANDNNLFAHWNVGVAYVTLADKRGGGERLNLIRSALRHFRRCQSLLNQKPDVVASLAEYINWCQEQLH
ncbi:hypothetical protein ES707_20187 [subsurface metagenome]